MRILRTIFEDRKCSILLVIPLVASLSLKPKDPTLIPEAGYTCRITAATTWVSNFKVIAWTSFIPILWCNEAQYMCLIRATGNPVARSFGWLSADVTFPFRINPRSAGKQPASATWLHNHQGMWLETTEFIHNYFPTARCWMDGTVYHCASVVLPRFLGTQLGKVSFLALFRKHVWLVFIGNSYLVEIRHAGWLHSWWDRMLVYKMYTRIRITKILIYLSCFFSLPNLCLRSALLQQ